MSDLGPLAAALAKAQANFPTVTRDKTVTVQTKTGGSYSFKYAPLDAILNAVRQPLASNGLVIVQLLDDGALVTSLIHESGAVLSGSIDLPNTDSLQDLGSAITYLRRYAIQGMLGIAAEDDDDGNRAVGNTVRKPPNRPPLERTTHEPLIGKVVASGTQDFQLRETPDGWVLPFRLKDAPNRAGQIVIAHGDLAHALATFRDTVIGQTASVWGTYSDEESPPKADGFVVRYKVLHLERIATPDFILPSPITDSPVTAPDAPGSAEAPSVAAFPEDDLSDLPDEWKA